MKPKIAIAGIVGVPACYGGFETLAENLVRYHEDQALEIDLSVFCSAKAYPERAPIFRRAHLEYIDLEANGIQSIFYDARSLLRAVRQGQDQVLLLGVSGAIALPVVRMLSQIRIITNLDGIEWKRDKWSPLARAFLRLSERLAVRWSHAVIADNAAIADHVKETYDTNCAVIPYGGDHALDAEPDATAVVDLPERYALALCRIEPENNIEMILEAFSRLVTPLVFVGNWNNTTYGRDLKARYKNHPTITLHNPIYEAQRLRAIRDGASMYIHGHSAGGTNPSLVEMMHFDIPILTHGCSFNRHTTEEKALYFMTAAELAQLVRTLPREEVSQVGSNMGEIARRRYTWSQIGRAYFELLTT